MSFNCLCFDGDREKRRRMGALRGLLPPTYNGNSAENVRANFGHRSFSRTGTGKPDRRMSDGHVANSSRTRFVSSLPCCHVHVSDLPPPRHPTHPVLFHVLLPVVIPPSLSCSLPPLTCRSLFSHVLRPVLSPRCALFLRVR